MQTYGTRIARELRTSTDYQARTRKPTAAGDGGARSPDLIYNADGTVAMDGPPDGGTHTSGWHGRVARLLALLGPAVLLLSKLKVLAIFSKVGLTGVSMLVSVWAYAALWNLGWAAAIGFVVLLFVHEMGHWIVMRLKGVPASAPLFIPFLGAVIGMKGLPRSVKDEAEIGIAGPIAGTAGALACLGLEALYGGRLWPLLALLGLYLNLFNLLPVSPLDGGRIVAAVSRWLWIVGLAGLVGLFVLHPNPFLLLIALIGGAETIARFRGRHAATARAGYYDVSMPERVTLAVLYFGLIALIAVTMLTNPVIRHLF
jgi:Zn-dependent protease